MNYEDKPSIDELIAILFESDDDDFLAHVGVDHLHGNPGSGRYPFGSGEEAYQHARTVRARILGYKNQNIPEADIAKFMGYKNTTELRQALKDAKNEEREYLYNKAVRLKKEGYSNVAIAREISTSDKQRNESFVRSLLNEERHVRQNAYKATAEFLKEQVEQKGMIDVSAGVAAQLNIPDARLKDAIKYLQETEGYVVRGGRIPQITNPKQKTTQQVLGKADIPKNAGFLTEGVYSIEDYITRDGGETYEKKFHYPTSIDSKRIFVRYAEDGGTERDGTVEIRRGVKDLDLGDSRIAQVRILVDGNSYIKGMARYSDDVPPGYDLIVNSNKKRGTPLFDPENPKAKAVLKPAEEGENPFGSLIKSKGGQSWYIDENGEKKLSAINKRAEEGDWMEWGDRLPAQFLAKQSKTLVKKQIDLSIASKQQEYEDIMAVTNPVVKQSLLRDFAGSCDSTALHLNAAALPRQKWHVIMPIPEMKTTEVYASQYENGEKVALVRYPHAGTYEIPILTVNNNHPQAKKVLGNIVDAVGINAKVAERLSGADFDGDTVMLIPTHDKAGKVKIISTDPLPELKGWDNKAEFVLPGGKTDPRHISKHNVGIEMGKISNLITDMDIKGATNEEKARAVKHSMVVIDADKHNLDYRKSYEVHRIKELQQKYQWRWVEDENGNGDWKGGPSTIVSAAKSQASTLEKKGQIHTNIPGKPWYDPTRPDGALVQKLSGRTEMKKLKDGTYVDTGKLKTTKSYKMVETDDAYTLVSEKRDPRELLYAEYANTMKRMANQARLEAERVVKPPMNPEAKKEYAKEVADLKEKLRIAESNNPRERAAQRLANSAMRARINENAAMTGEEKKKYQNLELKRAREIVGAQRHPISVTEREWEAIQKNAVSSTTLEKILRYADEGVIRDYATPRSYKDSMTPAKLNKIKSMNRSNYSIEEMAKAIGMSPSTVAKYLNPNRKEE